MWCLEISIDMWVRKVAGTMIYTAGLVMVKEMLKEKEFCVFANSFSLKIANTWFFLKMRKTGNI